MAKKDEVSFQVEIRMSRASADLILASAPGELPAAHKIAGLAAGALDQLAEGGLLLDGRQVERIRQTIGSCEPEDLIKAADAYQGMDRGAVSGAWRIDPVWVEPLRDVARSQGVTLEYLVQDMLDYAMNEGWLYQISKANLRGLNFSYPDLDMIAQILDKPTNEVTGTDVAGYLRRAVLGESAAEAA